MLGVDLALVPGLNNTRAVFGGVIDALPAQVRAHAWDNPELESVDAIAQWWLDRLPARFHLAGFSFGGYVAMAMLEAAPERIESLALVCTSPSADDEAARSRRLAALDVVQQGRYFETIDAQAANAFHPDSVRNEALMAARRAMVREYGPHRYVAHVRATAARPDRTALLDGRVPTLFVAGSHDALFPPERTRALAAQVPGARFEVIDGAGHLLPMERPPELARVLANWPRHARESGHPGPAVDAGAVAASPLPRG